MGWYFGKRSRADLITHLTNPAQRSPSSECLAHAVVGGVLWSVWKTPRATFIECDLIQSDRRSGTWGYKPMDEGMGPCYYSCPLRFLDMAPVACADWRENVRAWHAERSAQRAIARRMRIGSILTLKEGYSPSSIRVVSVKPLFGCGSDGRLYRVAGASIASVEGPS